MQNPNRQFWSGKRVLVTGHTGFKGSWLTLWLQQLGAEVVGISLPPNTEPNLFTLAGISDISQSHLHDIRDSDTIAKIVKQARADIVFHMAAQPLVRASYSDPLGTFSTNIQGTANLLDALRQTPDTRTVIAITTDKVYRNSQQVYPFRETDPLGGHDPYSASKAAAEIIIASYRDAFLKEQGMAVASARAGNVIGGGDWSEDRLIPDAVRSWNNEIPLQVRQPEAIRPWQHVLEPLAGYLQLAETLWLQPELAGGYNFGPNTNEAATVRKVVELAQHYYKRGEIHLAEKLEGPHEAKWLALEIAKARQQLNVQPRWDLEKGIKHTMVWYREQSRGASAAKLCQQNIDDFEKSVAN